MTSNELSFLSIVSDSNAVKLEQVKSYLDIVDSLIDKGYLEQVDEETVKPTASAITLIKAAKSGLNFGTIIPRLNFRTLTNLWHRLIEHCEKSGFHVNVVLKNLEPHLLDYMEVELSEAKEKIDNRNDMKNLINEEFTTNRDSDDFCEELTTL